MTSGCFVIDQLSTRNKDEFLQAIRETIDNDADVKYLEPMLTDVLKDIDTITDEAEVDCQDIVVLWGDYCKEVKIKVSKSLLGDR